MIDPYCINPGSGHNAFPRGCLLALVLAACFVALVVILGVCSAVASAEPAIEHGEQAHWTPDMPAPAFFLIWDGEPEHRIPMPLGMASRLAAVIECESRWNINAVGKLGERGLLQIHPVHRQEMARMGLDFESEPDRLTFAGWLWERRGWYPTWSCAR